jgi:ubiquinone biosynthesis protein UbiJ
VTGPPVDLGRERRIADAFAEIRALHASGAVDPERTRAMLAGDLEPAPMEADDEVPTSLRAPRALLTRAEALAEELSRYTGSAAKVSRSAVLRRALELGIAALEAEVSEQPEGPAGDDLAGLRARLDGLSARVARLEAAARSDGT